MIEHHPVVGLEIDPCRDGVGQSAHNGRQEDLPWFDTLLIRYELTAMFRVIVLSFRMDVEIEHPSGSHRGH